MCAELERACRAQVILVGNEYDVVTILHAMQHVQPAIGFAFGHFERRMHAGIGQRLRDLFGRRRCESKYDRPPAALLLHAVRPGFAASPQIALCSAAMSLLVLPIVADFDGRKP